MLRFSADPEDQSRIMTPSGRMDEIGVAERELAQMQQELSGLLAQKNRLAQLGLAVSKINHDLRNMLANAQLISDRLVDIPDPTVQRFVPKLIASLDRAISFCNSSLQFGRAAEAAPRRDLFRLKPLVEEVADSQGLPREGQIAFVVDIDDRLRIDADRDHLFRALSNLVRNAVQAIEASKTRHDGESRVARIARAARSSSMSATTARAFRRRRAKICSRRSRARPKRAARVSASSSPRNSCRRTAARWCLPTAKRAHFSASSCRTGPCADWRFRGHGIRTRNARHMTAAPVAGKGRPKGLRSAFRATRE